jgi:two-component system NtrC family sensor kinase
VVKGEIRRDVENSSVVDIQLAIAQAMGQVLNLDQIAPTALEEMAHHFRGADVALSLTSSHDDRLLPLWAMGDETRSAQFFRQEGELWDLSIRAYQDRSEEISPGSFVSYISDKNRLFGILIICNGVSEMEEIAEKITFELAQAAMRFEQISEFQQLSREMEILNRTAKSLTTSFDLDSILIAAMQGTWEMFPRNKALLTIKDFDMDSTHVKIPLTGEPDEISRYQRDDSNGLVNDCMRHRATVLLDDASENQSFQPEFDTASGGIVRSFMCVPLLAHEKALGAVSVFDENPAVFSKRDLDLLTTFASSVAVAISNAKLFHDVTTANTDLEHSRMEIERSRNTLLAIFDNLEDELYIIDEDYELIAVNRSRAKRVGEEPQRLVGFECYQVLENRDSPCTGCLIRRTFDQGIKTQRTEQGADDNGRTIIREIYTYPIVDQPGRVTRTILQLRDVTERRRLEASLIQAEKLAALGELAAGVAHEMNNPITAVIANTQLLKREIELEDESSESVELIEQAGKRAQKVVRALLDFARQEPQTFHPIDINHTLEQALMLVDRQWKDAKIILDKDLTSKLPQINGNSDHLQSVWLNLLINAQDALHDPTCNISVRSKLEGAQIVVEIQDTGMGIPPEDMQRIFDPFFTTKGPGKGTGLGLATCYRIIEQHHGSMEVESAPGEGSIFTVRLPVLASHEE